MHQGGVFSLYFYELRFCRVVSLPKNAHHYVSFAKHLETFKALFKPFRTAFLDETFSPPPFFERGLRPKH
jgi:hypothetical protein